MTASEKKRDSFALTRQVVAFIEGVLIIAAFALAARTAYRVRLYAIETYGRVIHEFDPWFNFRATDYLATNGITKFLTWFDHEAWYPIGRPVGTTIYPGMQFTSVAIWHVLKAKVWRKIFGIPNVKAFLTFAGLRGGKDLLNDICVYVPAWFGAVASVTLGLLTREVSGSWRAGAAGALVMSVVPAHLMRSVGGGYDNESVAVTAMSLTFLLWSRSQRNRESLQSALVWGILAGLASFYMAATWGGYVFVVNLVGIHAATLFIFGHFGPHLWLSYSCWYVVSTLGAMQVPVISQAPIRSLEQAGPLLVFLVFQFCAATDFFAKSQWGLEWPAAPAGAMLPATFAFTDAKFAKMAQFRFLAGVGAALAASPVIYWLAETGYFGPLSVRVKALFVKHTKTGNPLVDSVAEHQAASPEAYWHHLHYTYFTIWPGLALLAARGFGGSSRKFLSPWGLPWNGSDSLAAKWFPVVYFFVAYYFANKMSRLIILIGPVAAVLAGVVLGWCVEWSLKQFVVAACLTTTTLTGSDAGKELLAGGFRLDEAGNAISDEDAERADAEAAAEAAAAAEKEAADKAEAEREAAEDAAAAAAAGDDKKETAALRARRAIAKEKAKKADAEDDKKKRRGKDAGAKGGLPAAIARNVYWAYASPAGLAARFALAVTFFAQAPRRAAEFYQKSDEYAHQISHPSLMFKAKLGNGEEVMVNDYQEAYWWLRDSTPADSRVMSWWDYGYQINGIGKRTTIADGNTWNLEHIAMLGRMLTAPEKKAHSLVRLIADYVLIWTGGGGDDLAKSPHMARISSSVFDDVCGPADPLCQNFGFYGEGKPTPSMAASMLYKMHSADLKPGVTIDKRLFQEAFKSKYGLVRIWKVMNVSQESRAWLADPANRACDRPGSWYCPGQYPPPSVTGGIDISPPSTHRHLNYDDPHAYVEDAKSKAKTGKRAPPPKKAKKASS